MEVIFSLTSTTLCSYQKQIGFPLIITPLTNLENFAHLFNRISFHCFNENINHRPFWKDANCFFISRSNSASLSFLSSSAIRSCSGVCFSLPLPGKLLVQTLRTLYATYTGDILVLELVPICYVFHNSIEQLSLKSSVINFTRLFHKLKVRFYS
jgi:hypothetical protein